MFRAYFGMMKKEFIQVTRDRNMLLIIFFMPVIQLLLLGYAINTDVRNLALDLYDYDHSQYSREFGKAINAGDYFVVNEDGQGRESTPLWEMQDRFRDGSAEVALVIPEDFSEKLTRNEPVTVAVVADGSDANAARTGIGYLLQIVWQFSKKIVGVGSNISLHHTFLYNPELESVYFMIPGIVATLLTMVTITLTSMAIVRERELGTLEQLVVTPISITSLLLGKLTTFAILGFVEMCIALVVGIYWFKIPFVGSMPLLFALAALYLLTTLGIGMFFSTVTSTQQQAMFLAWFFSVFTILTSGFMTPISNMPEWLQPLTYLNPMRYFMFIVRGVIMKGSGFVELLQNIYPLVIYGVLIFSFAVIRFRKRTA